MFVLTLNTNELVQQIGFIFQQSRSENQILIAQYELGNAGCEKEFPKKKKERGTGIP